MPIVSKALFVIAIAGAVLCATIVYNALAETMSNLPF